QISSCWVTNLDTRPATISVKLTGEWGTDYTPPVGSGRPATLPPGQSCSSEPVYPDYCYYSVTSTTRKIRAAMLLFDGVTNQLDVEVPATRQASHAHGVPPDASAQPSRVARTAP